MICLNPVIPCHRENIQYEIVSSLLSFDPLTGSVGEARLAPTYASTGSSFDPSAGSGLRMHGFKKAKRSKARLLRLFVPRNDKKGPHQQYFVLRHAQGSGCSAQGLVGYPFFCWARQPRPYIFTPTLGFYFHFSQTALEILHPIKGGMIGGE
jgi:hypothetical protein